MNNNENDSPNVSFNAEAYATASEVAALVIKKQRDYGPKNILNCPVGPELGLIVRLSDKLARLSNLVQNGATPQNEALRDTWMDIMGYGLVGLMVNDKSFNLPLEDSTGNSQKEK